MYLNRWNAYFDPDKDITSTVPVWVKIPHLLLHCWGDEDLRAIGNALGKYIDEKESKPPIFHVQESMEVYLDKCWLKEIKLSMDGWTHLKKVDYEKIPFNYNLCHE